MRKVVKLALAATIATIAVPAAAYYLTTPDDDDPMAETLREFGFVRVPLASNLMNVGSLYYIDAGLKDFKTTCHVGKPELGEEDVIMSPGGNIERNLERKGWFDSGVEVDFGSLIKGTADNNNNYVHTVHFSLTDVVIEELSLDSSSLVFINLMSKPVCNDVAMKYVGAAPHGYVCQVQKTLKATAEYRIDREARNKLETNAKAADINDEIKRAIETHGDVSVVERDGRLFSGSALTYGVSMNPTCLAPPTGRFARVLPQNGFDRFFNFVLFSIVEPMWPAAAGPSEVAQNTHGA
jgi:hypothetical protein